MKAFTEYIAERGHTTNQMAARRSYNRSTAKFEPQITKPVAIVTAFRGGQELPINRAANAHLVDDLKNLELSFYPVIGAGQEQRRFLFILFQYVVPMVGEESFVVQPRADMAENEFEFVILRLLQQYGQFAAMVKLPSSPRAFLLYSDAEREYKASGVVPTTPTNMY